jgi:hypothetical protein
MMPVKIREGAMAMLEVKSVPNLLGTPVSYAYAVKAGPWIFLTGHEAFDFESGIPEEVAGPSGFPLAHDLISCRVDVTLFLEAATANSPSSSVRIPLISGFRPIATAPQKWASSLLAAKIDAATELKTMDELSALGWVDQSTLFTRIVFRA